MHILIASLPEFRWEAWRREHPTVAWSPLANGNRLQPVVEQALAAMFNPNVATDLTFSTRRAEVVMADLIETPEQITTGAPGCEIQVLCREGRIEGADDRWARVRRLPGRADIFSFGVTADVFRPQTLRTEIAGWFERAGWHTFGAPRPHRLEAGPPPHGRELLVRHGEEWRARLICPADFPKLPPQPTHIEANAAT